MDAARMDEPDRPLDPDLYSHDLASLFDLALIERGDDASVFSGRMRAPLDVWPHLYGGQVAAQALVAAGLTVAEGRRPHSLHGYFLRRGRTDQRVELHVDHDRDGGSFSARHVSAVQDGRVIFSMLASFTERVTPGVLDAAGNRAERYRDPDECPRYVTDPHLEARQVTEMRTVDDRRLHPDALWLRVPEALPDTSLARAAALTYLSDLGSGYGQMQQADIGTGGSSLDHAMWFHEELDVHDWIVLDMWPVSAVNGRGVYHGVLRDRHRRLGATMVQELLLRPPGTDR